MSKEQEFEIGNRKRNRFIAASVVVGSLLVYSFWNSGYAEHREEEQRSRETRVEEAASNFLDVIEVVEIDKSGDSVTANLIYEGEALLACEVTYDLHPDSNKTFDPNTLNMDDCFTD